MSRPAPVGVPIPPVEGARRRARLIALSSLMLFTELAAIRWTGAYVAYLAYFTNLALLASFLGIGVGFLRARARPNLFRLAPFALVALAGLVVLLPVEAGGRGGRAFTGGFGLPAAPLWIELPLAFVTVFAAMETIAEGVARTFVAFPPLLAYRLDIWGSLLGIASFTALAFLGAPPFVWALMVAVVAVVLLGRDLTRLGAAALLAFVVLAALQTFTSNDVWSPYNRISIERQGGRIAIAANGFPHQSMATLARLRQDARYYFVPYERAERLGHVLIVGAGAGNDAAVALASGARQVDAVEIDPELVRVGTTMNPEHPYADPRVRTFVEDGRAFLEDEPNRYDLIVFAFPQSVALLSGQSAVRLESYLLTEQALEQVRQHLAPGGTFSLVKTYRPDVIGAFAAMMRQVFGRVPCLDVVPSGGVSRAVLTVADHPLLDCRPAPGTPGAADAVTDDHPFPYLLTRTLPSLYVVALALVLLASIGAVRAVAGRLRTLRPFADLFLMGTAFLLLETSNVVRFALLFGTTWLVNALVFFGILLSVLAAVEVAERVRIRPPPLYAALVGAIALGWAIAPGSLLALSPGPRFVAATAIAFAPVFLANLVFAERFRDADDSTAAFGANLLGAMIGGVLEYAALVTGYRALLAIVAGVYLLAFAVRLRGARDADAATPVVAERATTAR